MRAKRIVEPRMNPPPKAIEAMRPKSPALIRPTAPQSASSGVGRPSLKAATKWPTPSTARKAAITKGTAEGLMP